MHFRFTATRARGREWYTPNKVLEQHIRSVIDQYGAPDGIVKEMGHANKKRGLRPFTTNVLR